MTVREALDQYAEFAPMTVRDLKGVVRKQVIQVDVLRLAADFEKALRASAEEMAELLTRVAVEKELVDRCVTAGTAAMTEGPDE